MTKKDKIEAYLKNRLTVGSESIVQMTMDRDGKRLPSRSAYLVVDKYLRDYQSGENMETRWVAIPGLRGVGKTTLVAQLYSRISCKEDHKIYISLDDASRSLNVTISDILAAYEDILGKPFEKLDSPCYIFLDEVQYDESWGITLKNIFDRTKNVFIICTGSSALSIQTNPDVARRLIMVKLYPLTFTEYRMIISNHYPIKMLGRKIREAIFHSSSAENAYLALKNLNSSVAKYWAYIDEPESELEKYLRYGTLPFAIHLKGEHLIYSQINQTLNAVLNKDVPQLNKFEKTTIDKLSQLLYIVASYDQVSFSNLASEVSLDIHTIRAIFEAFEKTELLLRVYPYGSHEKQVRKPSKYLFTSPAFRSMYYNLVGSTASFSEYKGKLFEDIAGLYLHRMFSTTDIGINYDSAKNGADFILKSSINSGQPITMEISTGRKSYDQVQNTLKKTKSKYGVVVSKDKLALSEYKTCFKVPISYFLLM